MKTFVCLSSYYKGYDFMDECKKAGQQSHPDYFRKPERKKTGPGML